MSQTRKLSIAFYWHMHQPVYQISPASDYLMPWVRLHAVKDYLDMVSILEKYENIKLNFNLVPVLLDALIDYGEKGFHDIHSRLTIMDIAKLSRDDKKFILNNFFDANYEFMILPCEKYNKLYQKYTSSTEKNTDIFDNQEYSDLMALFNLVWIDHSHRNAFPRLKKLIKKGSGYTKEDRVEIIKIQRQIIKKIIPAYRHFIEAGKIEVTTSPYYHPILPIMLDIKGIKKSNSDLPNNLNMDSDAQEQIKTALDRIEQLLGKRPQGMWPSEHAVSPKTLNMMSEHGIKWTISDEGILSESINFEFVRDFKGYMEDPYRLLKSYKYNNIKMVFRDSVIANLISFEYYNHNSVAAANDLYDRIKVVQSKLLSSPDENHLLTIAMDGENCWENYIEDGSVFLNAIYNLIENDPSLETVLLSDYIEKDTPKPLSKLASGSWINRNFNLWIDEPLKDLAWTYLKHVKDDFTDYAKKNPQSRNITNAQRELYICEGSDWFWWYGEPNDSGQDNLFDYIFREHLKNVYLYLGLDIPAFLETSLNEGIAKPSRYPKNAFTQQITGIENDEWLNAGCIDIPDGPVLKEDKLFDRICFGYDTNNLYFRFYINPYVKELPATKKRMYQMHIYMKNQSRKQTLSPVRVIHKTENVLPVIKEKFHNELQISLFDGKIYKARLIKALNNNLWALKSDKGINSAYSKTADVGIPFESLEVAPGETVGFLFINATYGLKDCIIPNDLLLSIQRPE